jgi:type I restriction enzyme S subunit
MAEVARLRAAAERQREAAAALPAAYLREVFERAEARGWPVVRLGDISKLLPAKSIATEGDTEVLAITTASLTEHGFQPSGIKRARMWSSDVHESIVSKGEVLIARSNTPELVGRVAMFPGKPQGAVASDLTIRIWPGPNISAPFLSAYLSFLYLSGYWKERAGGASGTMKKITRSQLVDQRIPLPSLLVQDAVVHQLESRISETARLRDEADRQRAAIEALPGALLREVFGGYAEGANHE